MSKPLNIIIVEKSGILKVLSIKDYKEEELYKKCGFKKKEDFIKQNEWTVKYDNKKYFIEIYAKKNGRANSENKYDFPPPIDSTLFFGNCAILAFIKKEDNTNLYVDLSLELWNKIYEKLFGGFEDLSTTAIEDENEEDELDKIPKEKKTKQGYLKDGFVVDSSDGDEDISESDDDENEYDNENSSEELLEDNDDCDVIIDLGSELSEDSYDDESDEDEDEK